MRNHTNRTAAINMLRDLADSIEFGLADPFIESIDYFMPPIVDRQDGAVQSTTIKMTFYGVQVYEHTGYKVVKR